jgi:hypothetical protein
MSAEQRREFHEAVLDADTFEDLPGKWQAAILKAEQNRPNLRIVRGDQFRGSSSHPRASQGAPLPPLMESTRLSATSTCASRRKR